MFITPTTDKNVCQRARAVYDAKIRHLVEPHHVGKLIAIEPDSGEFEFDGNLRAASERLKARRPGSLTCILRIGHEAVFTGVRGVPKDSLEPRIGDAIKYDMFWRRSQEIYDAEIRQWVEPAYKGKFLALDPDTGDCEVHDDVLGAVAQLGKRLPGAPFYVLQVGHRDSITGVIRGPKKV